MSKLRDELNNYRKYLMAMAMRMTKGHATRSEDLVQATFLRALEYEHSYNEKDRLGGWLGTILYSLFVREYRYLKKTYETQPMLVPCHTKIDPDQEHAVEWKETMVALAQIAPEKSDAVINIIIRGETYKEYADKCGVPDGTVKSRASRGRSELVSALA